MFAVNRSRPKYFDNASTTPVDDRVLQKMLPYFSEIFGNASSNHSYGKEASLAIKQSREQVANLIGADPKEIIFTSGATEAINLAIKGFVEANSNRGNHIITVKTEHKAVLNTCEYLETKGFEVAYLDVDSNGLISIEELENAIKEETILIAIMMVNNEIGVIQPIRAISKISRSKNVAFFTDATQAVGKMEIDVYDLDVDMMCFSAHKLYGPKGIGILFKKTEIELTPLIHGGGQENGIRGGTYNTPLIVGLGEACKLAAEEKTERIAHWKRRRKEIEKYFEENKLGEVNFKTVETVPNIISVKLCETDAEDFLMMKHKEFVASTGSACNAELIEPSHVLKELDQNIFKNTVRISF